MLCCSAHEFHQFQYYAERFLLRNKLLATVNWHKSLCYKISSDCSIRVYQSFVRIQNILTVLLDYCAVIMLDAFGHAGIIGS